MPLSNSNPATPLALQRAVSAGIVHTVEFRDDRLHHLKVNRTADVFSFSARRDGSVWVTRLDADDLRRLARVQREADLFSGPYLWIRCGAEFCVLRPDEWRRVVDLTPTPRRQHIYVERPPRCSFHVRGDGGRLSHTVRVNRFPSLALAA
jgi:hypothetical protein